jgi:hypothetical protein
MAGAARVPTYTLKKNNYNASYADGKQTEIKY